MLHLLLLCAAALAQAAPYPAPPGPADPRFDAFVPLPGFPSLRQGDIGGFGLSWLMVVPTTTVLVLAANEASERPHQLVAASAASYYLSTVAANQLVPQLRARSQVSVGLWPSQGGLALNLTLRGF